MILKQRNKSGEAFTLSENILHDAESLAVAVGQLRTANNFLTRQQQLQPHVRIMLNALSNARLLALWHCTGYATGRRAALTNGMSEHAFYYGRALCRAAMVHDGKRFTTAEIETALGVAVERCKAKPILLHKWLPLSRRPR
jgi:hypothetical protein